MTKAEKRIIILCWVALIGIMFVAFASAFLKGYLPAVEQMRDACPSCERAGNAGGGAG